MKGVCAPGHAARRDMPGGGPQRGGPPSCIRHLSIGSSFGSRQPSGCLFLYLNQY